MGIPFTKKKSKLNTVYTRLNIETVKRLLHQHDITIDEIFYRATTRGKQKTTFLHAAIIDKNVELIDWLVAKKVNPDVNIPKIGAPINVAITMRDLNTIRKLVSLGACLNFRDLEDGDSLLFQASLCTNTKIAECLIENGADVNEELSKSGKWNGYSLLQFYAQKGDVKMMKLILSKGANIDHRSARGWTSLFCAAQGGHLEAVKLLIDCGADINCVYKYRWDVITVLHAALVSRKVEVIELFLNLDEMAMDVNIKTKKNEMPILVYQLLQSVYNVKVFTFLLDAGLDVNAEYKYKVPIQYIADCSMRPIVQPTIEKHLMKLIAAGLPVCQHNKDALELKDIRKSKFPSIDFDRKSFAIECRQEVTRMKVTKVGDVNIMFYDVLHVGEGYLARKIKRFQSELNEMTNREKLSEMYPLYGGMLAVRMAKAKRRILRCEKAGETLMEIFIILELPYDFMRVLLDYLNLRDLKKIGGEKI